MERLKRTEIDKTGELLERLPWAEEEEFISKTMFTLITFYAKFSEVRKLHKLTYVNSDGYNSSVASQFERIPQVIRGEDNGLANGGDDEGYGEK